MYHIFDFDTFQKTSCFSKDYLFQRQRLCLQVVNIVFIHCKYKTFRVVFCFSHTKNIHNTVKTNKITQNHSFKKVISC